MHRCVALFRLILIAACAASCGGTVPTAPVAVTNLSGTWDATASDSQGLATMRLTLQHTNDRLTGTVSFKYAGGNDCNTCHRQTTGSVSGTVSANSVAFLMNFPAGNPLSPTPICSATIQGATSAVSSVTLSAGYFGEDSCMGKFSGGVLNLTRTSTTSAR